MGSVHFLNLEYIVAHVYESLTGIHVDVSQVPSDSVFVVGQIMLLGLAVSVFLLAAIVYIMIKLTIVEHTGLHHKEAKETPHQKDPEVNSKNPRWDVVMTLASSADEGEWRRAILEADSMLADLLNEKGYRGSSVGEQLKQANPLQFTTLQQAWSAHKMRNAIAHLGEAFPVDERNVKIAIDEYAQVFREFDII